MRKVDPVKHAEKRQEILEAAARCFARDGFHGATTAAICAEAGISPGHLYHYFASKEAIIAAMADAALERAAKRLGDIAEDSNIIATLAAEVEQTKPRHIRTQRPMLLEMMAEAGRNPAVAEILHKHSKGMRDLLAELVRKGQDAGEVDPSLDADLVAAILMSVVDSSKILPVRDPKLDKGKAMDLLKIMIARFLAPQKPASG
ncbi:TetR/AcrR family transcriptional regulator [Bradyrhizobium sp. SYSU BS000235]|uniref:TetR/AcrR family transcriptional regulator n=1 Tax=Bradyrhizobium sp. SYSU BS000235 TaxID=3411332 RepID=UPI003C72A47B